MENKLSAILEEAAETIENCYGRETELSDKLRNLLEVAEEGRLEVLPYALGSTLYVADNNEVIQAEMMEISFSHTRETFIRLLSDDNRLAEYRISRLLKVSHNTREEAKKALEREAVK